MAKRKRELKSAGRFSFLLSPVGTEAMAYLQHHTGLSRASVACVLLASRKVRPPSKARIWYPGKSFPPMSLALTERAAEALHAAKEKTGHSWSEILEALLEAHRDDPSIKWPETTAGAAQ